MIRRLTHLAAWWVALQCCLPGVASAASPQLVNDWGSSGLPNDVKMYVYVPDQVASKPPVLLLIHYCGGSAEAVFGQAQGGGIVQAADQHGFIMVVPSSGRCWDVVSDKTRKRGAGGDSDAIMRMVDYALQTYEANTDRVYATGDSSGGMMTELLLAMYPEVFKAGAAFAGMPAGCRGANESGNGGGYSGACAGGMVTHDAAAWGDIARGLAPGYAGPRPRVQLFHGDNDDIIKFPNHTEAIKEWSNVLGLGQAPSKTEASVTLGDHQATRQTWQNACGQLVLDAFTSLGGDHGPSDALFESKYVVPFLGLDQPGAVDPVVAQCAGGGAGGGGGSAAGAGSDVGGAGGAVGLAGATSGASTGGTAAGHAGSASSDDGHGGSGVVVGSAGSGQPGSGDALAAAPADNSGCACALREQADGQRSWIATCVLGSGLAGLRRRRAKRKKTMKNNRASLLLTLLALVGFACSSDGGGAPGGGAGTGTNNGTAGTTPGASGSGAGTAPSAGAGGAAGSVAMAGAGGHAEGGVSGSAPTGGGGASAGGSGGSASVAKPSAGCTKASGRPQGGAVTVAGDHYFTFPESYDGTKPMPVLIGFHGCGEVNRGTDLNSTEWIRLTKGSAFETDYVRAVPISSDGGGCWSYGNDIGRVKSMYDDLLADYCVDTGRVFATGHSSGAQFVVQILLKSHSADAQHLNFKGVAPVAASDYGAMAGPIPAMYIQGKMDAERGKGDGHETVAQFRSANSCQDSSMPYAQVLGCQSGNTAVDPGCISYDGCQAPTIWCSHNDPAYSGTMHGVPCFGVKAMHDFFESLP